MIKIKDKNYKEIRCYKCRRLLGYEYVYSGRLLIKCKKCGFENSIIYKSLKNAKIEK
jgi:phage FluMu protein Com